MTAHTSSDIALPIDWTELRFDDCISAPPPRRPSVQQNAYLSSGLLPVVDQGNQFVAGYTNDESLGYRLDELPLIVFGDHTRAIKFVEFPFATGADGTKLIAANVAKLDAKFLYFALRNLRIPSRGYNRHYSYLREAVLPLPSSLDEQRTISAVLSRIDHALALEEKRLSTLKELKSALMTRVLHRGIYGEPLKKSEIGEVPASWEIVALGSPGVASIRSGAVSFNELPVTNDPVAVSVLAAKVSDMNRPGNEKHLRSAAITFRALPEVAKRIAIPPGAIVFPKRGAAIATNKKRISSAFTLLDPNLIAVVPTASVDTEYLFAYFERLDLTSLQDPGSIPQLNKKDLDPLLIARPTIEEQKAIARVADTFDRAIDAARSRHSKLTLLFESALDHLVTGKVRITPLLEQESHAHA